MTSHDLTNQLDQRIAEKVGQQRHGLWFKNTTRFQITDEHVRISVPNGFIGAWIETHFAEAIAEAAKEITGSKVNLAFFIDPVLSQRLKKRQLDSQVTSLADIPKQAAQEQRRNNSAQPTKRLSGSTRLGVNLYQVQRTLDNSWQKRGQYVRSWVGKATVRKGRRRAAYIKGFPLELQAPLRVACHTVDRSVEQLGDFATPRIVMRIRRGAYQVMRKLIDQDETLLDIVDRLADVSAESAKSKRLSSSHD